MDKRRGTMHQGEGEVEEGEVLSLEEIRDIMSSEIGSKAKIIKLELTKSREGLALEAELDGGIKAGKIKLKGSIANSDRDIALSILELEARGYVQKRIKDNLSILVDKIKEYLQKEYKKPVASLQIVDQGVAIEFEGAKAPAGAEEGKPEKGKALKRTDPLRGIDKLLPAEIFDLVSGEKGEDREWVARKLTDWEIRFRAIEDLLKDKKKSDRWPELKKTYLAALKEALSSGSSKKKTEAVEKLTQELYQKWVALPEELMEEKKGPAKPPPAPPPGPGNLPPEPSGEEEAKKPEVLSLEEVEGIISKVISKKAEVINLKVEEDDNTLYLEAELKEHKPDSGIGWKLQTGQESAIFRAKIINVKERGEKVFFHLLDIENAIDADYERGGKERFCGDLAKEVLEAIIEYAEKKYSRKVFDIKIVEGEGIVVEFESEPSGASGGGGEAPSPPEDPHRLPEAEEEEPDNILTDGKIDMEKIGSLMKTAELGEDGPEAVKEIFPKIEEAWQAREKLLARQLELAQEYSKSNPDYLQTFGRREFTDRRIPNHALGEEANDPIPVLIEEMKNDSSQRIVQAFKEKDVKFRLDGLLYDLNKQNEFVQNANIRVTKKLEVSFNKINKVASNIEVEGEEGPKKELLGLLKQLWDLLDKLEEFRDEEGLKGKKNDFYESRKEYKEGIVKNLEKETSVEKAIKKTQRDVQKYRELYAEYNQEAFEGEQEEFKGVFSNEFFRGLKIYEKQESEREEMRGLVEKIIEAINERTNLLRQQLGLLEEIREKDVIKVEHWAAFLKVHVGESPVKVKEKSVIQEFVELDSQIIIVESRETIKSLTDQAKVAEEYEGLKATMDDSLESLTENNKKIADINRSLQPTEEEPEVPDQDVVAKGKGPTIEEPAEKGWVPPEDEEISLDNFEWDEPDLEISKDLLGPTEETGEAALPDEREPDGEKIKFKEGAKFIEQGGKEYELYETTKGSGEYYLMTADGADIFEDEEELSLFSLEELRDLLDTGVLQLAEEKGPDQDTEESEDREPQAGEGVKFDINDLGPPPLPDEEKELSAPEPEGVILFDSNHLNEFKEKVPESKEEVGDFLQEMTARVTEFKKEVVPVLEEQYDLADGLIKSNRTEYKLNGSSLISYTEQELSIFLALEVVHAVAEGRKSLVIKEVLENAQDTVRRAFREKDNLEDVREAVVEGSSMQYSYFTEDFSERTAKVEEVNSQMEDEKDAFEIRGIDDFELIGPNVSRLLEKQEVADPADREAIVNLAIQYVAIRKQATEKMLSQFDQVVNLLKLVPDDDVQKEITELRLDKHLPYSTQPIERIRRYPEEDEQVKKGVSGRESRYTIRQVVKASKGRDDRHAGQYKEVESRSRAINGALNFYSMSSTHFSESLEKMDPKLEKIIGIYTGMKARWDKVEQLKDHPKYTQFKERFDSIKQGIVEEIKAEILNT